MTKQQPTALVVALNNLAHDSRVLAEAETLHSAGYVVTAVGIVQTPDDEREQPMPFGRIVRVLSSSKALERGRLGVQPESRGKSPARMGVIADARVFFGRLREDWRVYRATRAIRPDVVITCDLNALPIGFLFRRSSGSSTIYDVHELWTDQPGVGGRLLKALYRIQERFLIGRADAVVTVNAELARVLTERYALGVPPYVVYNGPSECRVPNAEVATPLRLIAQGTYSSDRGLDELLDAMHRLRGTAHLSLQGYGPLEAHLRRRVEEEGLRDVVRFVEPCAPGDVVASASAYDVGLVSIKPTCLNSELSTPNRLFSYLGAGLCVVASDIPAVRSIVQTAGCGIVLESLDRDHIVRAVCALAADPERVVDMKRRSSAACADYSWAVQAKVMLEAVSQAVQSRAVRRA